MKKTFLPIWVLLACLLLNADLAYANVYASGIKISDDSVSTYENAGSTWDGNFANGGLKVWFVINENGVGSLTAVVTIMQGVTVVRTLNVTAPAMGVNSVIWDGYDDLSNPAPIGTYTFEVTVSDPTGYSAFDSLWVAGAAYQGVDFDGGTSFAYRGNASIFDQTSIKFGNIYVARGTSSANGFYEIRADGEYLQKIGTDPSWPNSTPNELATAGEDVFGLAGYGFTGAGYVKGFNSVTNTLIDSGLFGNSNVRGLVIEIDGADTLFFSGRAGTGVQPAIVIKTGINGDTSTYIDMRPYIAGNGYIKSIAMDDLGNMYVAFGEASASRKKIALFDSNGSLIALDSLDGTTFGLASNAIFQSLAISKGNDPNSISDDKIFALIQSGTSSQNGIYLVCAQFCFLTQQISPVGVTSSATSQQLGVDPAGNIIWSNGSTQERIVAFSPANGPNSYTTVNPEGLDITVSEIIPVELISFSANAVSNGVMLSWSTATETNNQGFNIERKINGNWSNIGFMQGAGTTTERKEYSFIDENISASGKIIYRLKQVDFDGTAVYSKEVEVEINIPGEFTLAQNYPNPFNPATTISFNLPFDSHVKLEIFSLTGELAASLVDEFRSAGEHNVNFNAGNLSSGTYIYRMSAGDVVLTNKMMLLK